MASRKWPKKRILRLIKELDAFSDMVAETSGHDPRIYYRTHAGCGVCVAMKKARELTGFIANWHINNDGVK